MINNIYKLLRIRNDFNAILKGKGMQRVGRRISGRISGNVMKGFFK